MRRKVCIITLDLKKAFDSIDHNILIKKLLRYGFDTKRINCFSDYLNDRKQCVCVGDRSSETLNIEKGIAQGSVLGPTLFSIYINDIIQYLRNICDITLYADDTTIIIAENNWRNLELKANRCLELLSQWLTANKLTLNFDKSNYLLINIGGRAVKDLNVHLNDISLSRVSSTKILGLVFDERLNFEEHCKRVSIKVKQKTGLLSRIGRFLPNTTLNMVYKALILPHIDYGISLYGHTYSTHLSHLERLQKRAALF